MRFDDRIDAGRQLAGQLAHLRGRDDVVVVGLPRGGVPVAAAVAVSLGAPLDVIVVRKVGVPYQPELAMGAIGEGGVRVVNDDVVHRAGISEREFAAVEAREREELDRRAARFRQARPRIPLEGKEVVVVDDGIATGSTARAACQVARAHGARRIVLATPVASPEWTTRLAGEADEFACVAAPEAFWAVGQFYADFSQTTDDEVVECLRDVALIESEGATGPSGPPPIRPGRRQEEVAITVDGGEVTGDLSVPKDATGVVVFAHGSGSSRHSARNRQVASVLEEAGLATLLFDLLTLDEEHDRARVFDIELLADRLVAATEAVRAAPDLAPLPIGYFGASTGAAAALVAAARARRPIAAVVSRGGRPDLAGPHLPHVEAPTLLIVGGADTVVLELNREAQARLRDCRLEVVPGATHLFEEPGTLQQAAELARDFLVEHLTPAT